MDSDSQKQRGRVRNKWLLILAALVVVGVIILGVVLPSSRSSVIQARLDAIKRAGEPVMFEDLAKMYPPLPDDQNSVVIYQKAFAQCVATNNVPTNWPILGESPNPIRYIPLPPDAREGIGNYLQLNQSALESLHQAALIERGYYTNEFELPGRLVPFNEIRLNAQLLAMSAIWNADQGRTAEAAQAIKDSLRLADSLKDSPLLLSQLIRRACLGLSCDSLERALNRTAFSDDELKNLSVSFHAAEPTDALKPALMTERCLGIDFGKRLMNDMHDKNGSIKDYLGGLITKFKIYRESDFILYLDTMEKTIAACDLPEPKRLQVEIQLNDAFQASPAGKRAFGIVLPQLHSCFRADAKASAQMLLAESALAIERYQIANHGEIPDSLQKVVPAFLPAVPIDPFDGQPLRYKKLPNGYFIYSVGPDGKDNGGKDQPLNSPPANLDGYDITFTVERQN